MVRDMFLRLGVCASVLVAPLALADALAPNLDDILGAPKLAYLCFAQNNPEHLNRFYGYKIWKEGSLIHVKIYTQEGGGFEEFNFNCYKPDGTTLTCEPQSPVH